MCDMPQNGVQTIVVHQCSGGRVSTTNQARDLVHEDAHGQADISLGEMDILNTNMSQCGICWGDSFVGAAQVAFTYSAFSDSYMFSAPKLLVPGQFVRSA